MEYTHGYNHVGGHSKILLLLPPYVFVGILDGAGGGGL
jgi:hypothetical protein